MTANKSYDELELLISKKRLIKELEKFDGENIIIPLRQMKTTKRCYLDTFSNHGNRVLK